MKVLVDTHAFLWFMTGDARLSRAARRAIEGGENGWWLSAASVWELAIKSSLGRLTLPAPASSTSPTKSKAGFASWTSSGRMRPPSNACRSTTAIPSIGSSSRRRKRSV